MLSGCVWTHALLLPSEALPAAKRVQISNLGFLQVLRTDIIMQGHHQSYWSYKEFSAVGNLALNRGKKTLREDSNLTRFSSGPPGDRATVYLPCMQRVLHLRTQPYSGELCTADHNQHAWIWEVMMFWCKCGAGYGAGKAVLPNRQPNHRRSRLSCVEHYVVYMSLIFLQFMYSVQFISVYSM